MSERIMVDWAWITAPPTEGRVAVVSDDVNTYWTPWAGTLTEAAEEYMSTADYPCDSDDDYANEKHRVSLRVSLRVDGDEVEHDTWTMPCCAKGA